ncbi:chemerin-like receptor 1 [Anomaloglossus baeobatrachus]|uniref:chemerin-like receptor 1 n=1 Tax=Anomaloglossus baeobatrachus TaxID=238106 RepID=UPI003F4F71C9
MENNTTAYPISGTPLLNGTSTNPTDYYDDYNDVHYVLSSIDYFVLVMYSLTFLLGTLGNSLIIWFAIFRMKMTINVIWFLNLSIVDFIFILFLPLRLIYLANNFNWLFGHFMCKLSSMVVFINLYVSVFLLAIISMDRCASVIFPVWCRNHRTPRLALIVVMTVWILAILFSIPYFIFRDTFEGKSFVVCYTNFELEDSEDIGIYRHRVTVIIRFIVGFCIPFIIIVMCYSLLAVRIRRKNMATSSKPFKVIIAVIIAFFICWAPFHIFAILEFHSFAHDDYFVLRGLRFGVPIATSLPAFMNSCVNPFLYVFIGRDFRDKFWKSFQNILEKSFS